MIFIAQSIKLLFQSIEVTVANLPRSIRSTRGESDARIGIVSVSGNEREVEILRLHIYRNKRARGHGMILDNIV